MSGTSGDGVDVSILASNGVDYYEVIKTSILNMILIFMKKFILLKRGF